MTHPFIQHLLKDHQTQRDAARNLAQAKTVEERAEYRQTLYDALYPHIEGEDASIFKYLKELEGEAHAGALEAMQEHHVDRMLLDELMALDLEDENLIAKAKVLKEINGHHLDEEEEEHFPKLVELADENKLDALFAAYESAEENFKS